MRAGLSTQTHVRALERSGLSVAEYSRRTGKSRWTLYAAMRGGERKSAIRRGARLVRPGDKALTFTEVRPAATAPASEIRLRFPDGIEVTLLQAMANHVNFIIPLPVRLCRHCRLSTATECLLLEPWSGAPLEQAAMA